MIYWGELLKGVKMDMQWLMFKEELQDYNSYLLGIKIRGKNEEKKLPSCCSHMKLG